MQHLQLPYEHNIGSWFSYLLCFISKRKSLKSALRARVRQACFLTFRRTKKQTQGKNSINIRDKTQGFGNISILQQVFCVQLCWRSLLSIAIFSQSLKVKTWNSRKNSRFRQRQKPGLPDMWPLFWKNIENKVRNWCQSFIPFYWGSSLWKKGIVLMSPF